MGSNDIDRHVSLEVEFAGLDGEYRIPRLHVRRWSSGLCFFKGQSTRNVIFPWPASIESITP